jgi:hypothetical protein
MSRDAYLKRTYGISEAEYDAMWIQQGGCCWICKEPSPEDENLCVDHNHRTGETRGLTCQRCNRVLGMVNDNVEILFRIIEYIRCFDRLKFLGVPLGSQETQDTGDAPPSTVFVPAKCASLSRTAVPKMK